MKGITTSQRIRIERLLTTANLTSYEREALLEATGCTASSVLWVPEALAIVASYYVRGSSANTDATGES